MPEAGLNPIASLVVSYRQVIFFGINPDLSILSVTTLITVVVLLVGVIIFRRLSPHFADEL